MALQTRDLSKGTTVQVLNEISIEYDFFEPPYIVKSLGLHQELPPFEATCEIFKDNLTYACIGEPASQKQVAKQNAAAKVLETHSKKYVFLEEKLEKCVVTESKFLTISDKSGRKAFQKWTNACERCFQRGHLAHNCRNPLRNKKYKNNS